MLRSYKVRCQANVATKIETHTHDIDIRDEMDVNSLHDTRKWQEHDRCFSIWPVVNDGIERSVLGITIPETSASRRGAPRRRVAFEDSSRSPRDAETLPTSLLTEPHHVAIRRWDFRDIKSCYKVGDLFIPRSLIVRRLFAAVFVGGGRRGITGRYQRHDGHPALPPLPRKPLKLTLDCTWSARDESILGEIFARTQLPNPFLSLLTSSSSSSPLPLSARFYVLSMAISVVTAADARVGKSNATPVDRDTCDVIPRWIPTGRRKPTTTRRSLRLTRNYR